MELTWYGLSCFRITERNYATVVTDPYAETLGLPGLKLKADVATVSHQAKGHNYTKDIAGLLHEIDGPGEYEIGGVFITGIPTNHTNNVLYVFNYGNLTVAHLGDMQKVPSQTQIEALEEINILLVPVGGGSSLNAAQAAELVSMLEPNIVVPMHYALPGLKVDLDGVDRFLKEMGVTDLQEEASLKVTEARLPEETETILLAPRI